MQLRPFIVILSIFLVVGMVLQLTKIKYAAKMKGLQPLLSSSQNILPTTHNGTEQQQQATQSTIKQVPKKCSGALTVQLMKNMGIGNQLFLYATLLCVSNHTGHIPVYNGAQKSINRLIHIFPNLGINQSSIPPGTRSVPVAGGFLGKCCVYDPKIWNISCEQNSRLDGYLQSWKNFEACKPELKRRLEVLDPEVKQNADDVIAKTLKNATVGDGKTPIKVGIHMRRGDYANKNMADFGFLASKFEFVRKAIGFLTANYFRNSTGAVPVYFLSCQEPEWCRKELPKENLTTNFFILGQNQYVDFAVMLQMDYLVLSAGSSTFGWWSAYLGKNLKMAVMSKLYAKNGSRLLAQLKPDDYYYFDRLKLL